MNIPNDPVMLLSFVNTQLRDFYPSLDEFCSSFNVNADDIKAKLSAINYEYDKSANTFK